MSDERAAATSVQPGHSVSGVHGTQNICIFKRLGEYFGTATQNVQEVVRIGDVTPMHRTPSFMLGLSNLRGHVLPVVILDTFIGLEESRQLTQQVLVFRVGETILGAPVDRVVAVLDLPEGEIRRSGGGDRRHRTGMFRFQDEWVTHLDAEALVNEIRLNLETSGSFEVGRK